MGGWAREDEVEEVVEQTTASQLRTAPLLNTSVVAAPSVLACVGDRGRRSRHGFATCGRAREGLRHAREGREASSRFCGLENETRRARRGRRKSHSPSSKKQGELESSKNKLTASTTLSVTFCNCTERDHDARPRPLEQRWSSRGDPRSRSREGLF